jgi:hypothetical protein
MVFTPLPGISNVIASTPPTALALRIACLSEAVPKSLVFATRKVAAALAASIATSAALEEAASRARKYKTRLLAQPTEVTLLAAFLTMLHPPSPALALWKGQAQSKRPATAYLSVVAEAQNGGTRIPQMR